MFAPLAAAEFSRVLIPGGLLIRVTPTARHLWGLKSAVYEKPYENDETRPPMPGFAYKKTERVEYKLTLSDKSDIRALFDMTPYSHKTSRRIQKSSTPSKIFQPRRGSRYRITAADKSDLIYTGFTREK